jgi:putative MATE family efflux protein
LSSSQKSPLKDILKTSFPAVVDLSSQTITWLIEAIFIGHLSAAALAGVGIALQIILLTFTVVLTFVVGASVIILRYLGAKDSWNANHVLGQALMMGTILSVVISLVWYFGGTQILTIIREEEPNARIYGVQYLKVLSYFGPFIIVNFIALGIMRLAGDTMLTMKVNIFTNIVHITLSPLLIFGHLGFPRLEAQGAAVAASTAHTLALFYTVYYLRSRKSVLFLSFREYTSINFETFKRLFKLGVPTTVEQLVWAVGQLILSFYAARMGIIALAAHQVFLRIQSVLTMAFTGFGLASMTLVGKNIGAAEDQQALFTGRVAGRVALVFAGIVTLLLILFRKPLLSVFTSNQEVINYGAYAIIIFALIQIPKAVNIVFTGNLRGSADLSWLMWLAVTSVIIFETMGAYIFSFVFHLMLMGLWLIQGMDETFRLSLNYWRFKKQKWSTKDIF